MNQAMKVTIPKHIDPREIVRKAPTTEIINLSMMMKSSGSTPFRYVKAAFKRLTEGDYKQAMQWLDYARDFVGVFWPEGSEEDNDFKYQLGFLGITMLFLIEKFEDLKPEE